MSNDHPTHDDVGNFALRLGYIAGAMRDPKFREYLTGRGATEETIDAAFNTLTKLADEAFYRRMGQS